MMINIYKWEIKYKKSSFKYMNINMNSIKCHLNRKNNQMINQY